MATIRIANMNCGGCAKGVLASLHKACLGADASVDLPNRQVTLGVADTAAAIAALRADGWDAAAT